MTCSLKPTTMVIHFKMFQRRVQFATCQDGRLSLWLQPERSARTAGPPSTEDIWLATTTPTSAEAIFAGTRHRKLQLAEDNKTKHWSTLLKSSVGHCRVLCIQLEESWPVSFALNDESSDKDWCKIDIVFQLFLIHTLTSLTSGVLQLFKMLKVFSGGASVFASRGKRMCCRPRQSDQFCNQGIFQDFGHRVWTNLWGPYSSISFHSLFATSGPLSPLPLSYKWAL